MSNVVFANTKSALWVCMSLLQYRAVLLLSQLDVLAIKT